MVENSKQVKPYTLLEFLGTLLGVSIIGIWTVVFFFLFKQSSLLFPSEPKASLFSKAGSLLVVLAVITEYLAIKGADLYLSINNNLASGASANTISFVMHFRFGSLVVTMLTAVIGTIVGAYGDLFYPMFFE